MFAFSEPKAGIACGGSAARQPDAHGRGDGQHAGGAHDSQAGGDAHDSSRVEPAVRRGLDTGACGRRVSDPSEAGRLVNLRTVVGKGVGMVWMVGKGNLRHRVRVQSEGAGPLPWCEAPLPHRCRRVDESIPS
jgi:hypothetical protein